MPVRILTRARAGDPWQQVASTVVYRLPGTSGTDGVNPSLPINATLASQLRVEALRGYSLTGVPLTLTLDDTMAMSPALRLSSVAQVVIGARISKSGNAMPQPGDLQGLSPAIAVGTRDLALEIGEVVR